MKPFKAILIRTEASGPGFPKIGEVVTIINKRNYVQETWAFEYPRNGVSRTLYWYSWKFATLEDYIV